MASYTLKKFFFHLSVCAVIWLLIDFLSPQGRLYAGWFSGFLGACYLLAAWFSYLKSKGTNFLAKLRRHHPQVPYYLRGAEKEQKPRLSLNGIRHIFDDDLAETAEERASEIPLPARQKLNAVAWAAVGVALLIWAAV